jgi:hypothetical protein
MRRILAVAMSCLAGLSLSAQTVPNGSGELFAVRLDSTRWSEHRWSAALRSPGAQKLSPIASAIVPGSGQYMLGNDRFIGYLAVEVLAWLQYTKNAREQRAQEAEFKLLARRIARAGFATGSVDELPDADWAYYEKMRDYLESGPYSLTLTGLTPDTNVATYNGSRWQLAQATFSTREAALAEYMRTAVRPEFEWSWTNNQIQFNHFVRTTDKRNDAHSAAQWSLLIVGANHVLSMIDAFTTVRLRATPSPGGGASIGAAISW